jgi:hypothetical protein
MKSVHLNEFLRRLSRKKPSKDDLESMKFERILDDMNIGKGVWTIERFGSGMVTFYKEGIRGKIRVSWHISENASSILIDGVHKSPSKRLGRKNLIVFNLGGKCRFDGGAMRS